MKKFSRVMVSVVAGLLGLLILLKLHETGIIPQEISGAANIIYGNLGIIVFIIISLISFFTLAIPISRKISRKIEELLTENTLQDILIDIVSIAIGLGVANLMGSAFGRTKINMLFILLLYIGLGYFGYYVAQLKNDEIKNWFTRQTVSDVKPAKPKILDTSVIIDGRIVDILETSFIEGKIIIPVFVLEELRHIADSSDSLKRNRGRRGLDILNEMQKNVDIDLEIVEKDYRKVDEVDSKLIKLAEEMEGALVTNDYNLNKVASFQKMSVLNINELANSVKPVVLPGENMQILVVKEGKEDKQGIGYLNDGTMVVVEGGKKHVDSMLNVVVTSVLQTSAGRMIFTKVK